MRAERAAEVLRQFTPERLRSLVGRSQWYRIYRPSPTGEWMRDREIGYYRLEILDATSIVRP